MKPGLTSDLQARQRPTLIFQRRYRLLVIQEINNDTQGRYPFVVNMKIVVSKFSFTVEAPTQIFELTNAKFSLVKKKMQQKKKK